MLKFMLKSSLCSQSLSCTCFCGWFSASRTQISSTYAPRTPQKIWAQLTKNFSQNQAQKDSESTYFSYFMIFMEQNICIYIHHLFVFLYRIPAFIEFLPSNCSLYFRSRQRERSLNNILFYIEHLLEKWKKNAKAYDKNCHRQELGNAMIETA